MDAAKGGDFAAAQGHLVAIVAMGGAPGSAVDLEVAQEMMALTFALEERSSRENVLGGCAATRALLQRLIRGKDRMLAAKALVLEAVVSERLEHDRASARESYSAVLKLDSENQEAREGIARLDLVEAMIAAKIREQELVQRTLEQATGPDASSSQP